MFATPSLFWFWSHCEHHNIWCLVNHVIMEMAQFCFSKKHDRYIFTGRNLLKTYPVWLFLELDVWCFEIWVTISKRVMFFSMRFCSCKGDDSCVGFFFLPIFFNTTVRVGGKLNGCGWKERIRVLSILPGGRPCGFLYNLFFHLI